MIIKLQKELFKIIVLLFLFCSLDFDFYETRTLVIKKEGNSFGRNNQGILSVRRRGQ